MLMARGRCPVHYQVSRVTEKNWDNWEPTWPCKAMAGGAPHAAWKSWADWALARHYGAQVAAMVVLGHKRLWVQVELDPGQMS